MENKIKKGSRFEHSKWLSAESYTENIPQIFEITRIVKHKIYYRPVYKHGDREVLGNGYYESRVELALK